MFLILINIEACFLLNTLWITKQVGMGRFSQYSLVFFFFLNVSIRFLPLLFLKFQCSTSFICPVTETYYCELRLEKEKNIFKVNSLLLKSLFPRRCFFFQIQQWKLIDKWNMFKANNKESRMTSMTAGFKLQFIYERLLLFSLFYIHIVPFSSARMATTLGH